MSESAKPKAADERKEHEHHNDSTAVTGSIIVNEQSSAHTAKQQWSSFVVLSPSF